MTRMALTDLLPFKWASWREWRGYMGELIRHKLGFGPMPICWTGEMKVKGRLELNG